MPGRVSPDVLQAGMPSDERVRLLQPADRAAATGVVGRAFAGTPSTEGELAVNWAIGPSLATLGDPARDELVKFIMSFVMVSHVPISTVLTTVGADAQPTAICMCRRLHSGKSKRPLRDLLVALRLIWRAWRRKQPPTALHGEAKHPNLSSSLQARGDVVKRVRSRMHKTHAPGAHWYIEVLATDPPQQGLGLGSALARAVARMADAERVPCYLECSGAKKRRFYEHLGYKCVGTYALRASGKAEKVGADEPTTNTLPWPDFEEFHAMIREPGGS